MFLHLKGFEVEAHAGLLRCKNFFLSLPPYLCVMSTIITIYLIVALFVVVIPMLLKFTLSAAFYILFLPAMPFIVAYRNWKIKPIQSRIIVVLWSTLYFVLILLGIFS